MHLSLSAQWTLKDRPEKYRGVTSERISYGSDTKLPFSLMASYVLFDMLHYYIRFDDADTLNEGLDILRERLAEVKVIEEQIEGSQ